MLVRVSTIPFARGTAGAACARHSLRPLFFEGEPLKPREHRAARGRRRAKTIDRFTRLIRRRLLGGTARKRGVPLQNPNSRLLHRTLFWVGCQRTIESQRGEIE